MTTDLANDYCNSVVPGGGFEPSSADPTDTRATGLKAQLDDMGSLMIDEEQTQLSEHAVAAIQNLWREAMVKA